MLEVLRSSTGEPNQSTPNSIRALQILGASMRRQLLPIILAVSLVGFAGFARADGYENPRAAAPVALQVSNWTGFYANGGVGYGLWDSETTVVNPATGACVICSTTDHSGRGWLGEVGVGYDAQITEKIVLGAFFNYDFSSMKGTIEDQSINPLGGAGKTDNDSTWFVGARGGWLMTPSVLNYWASATPRPISAPQL